MSAALRFDAVTPSPVRVPRPGVRRFASEPGAYRWWYFDAVSDDGQLGLVAIFFVGSVFSPYYAARFGRGERPSPEEHVAVNVALYGPRGHLAWCFSEYDGRFRHEEDGARVADSSFQRVGNGRYELDLRDVRTFSGKPVRGRVTFEAEAPPLTAEGLPLAGDRHGWRCHSPAMRVHAHFSDPRVAFHGHGYHDENWGLEPPSKAMESWSWVRGRFGRRHRVVFDTALAGGERSLLVVDSQSGVSSSFRPRRRTRPSPRSWLLPLPDAFEGGPDDGGRALRLGTPKLLERAPFYARFLAPFPSPGGIDGRSGEVLGMGEHVDFRRFSTELVRFLVGFRIARPDLGRRGILP